MVCGVSADTVRRTGLEWAGGATGAGAEHVPPSHSLPALGTSGAGHLRGWPPPGVDQDAGWRAWASSWERITGYHKFTVVNI